MMLSIKSNLPYCYIKQCERSVLGMTKSELCRIVWWYACILCWWMADLVVSVRGILHLINISDLSCTEWPDDCQSACLRISQHIFTIFNHLCFVVVSQQEM